MGRRHEIQTAAQREPSTTAKELGLPDFWRLRRRPLETVRPAGFQILRTLWRGERRV